MLLALGQGGHTGNRVLARDDRIDQNLDSRARRLAQRVFPLSNFMQETV